MMSFHEDRDLSLQHTAKHGKVRPRPKRALHVHGLRWGLFGLVLYSQCINVFGAVPEDSCPAVLLPVYGAHELSSLSLDSQVSCSQTSLVLDWDDCNITTGPLGSGTPFGSKDELHGTTALEDGKGGAFRRTCAELGWFLTCVHDHILADQDSLRMDARCEGAEPGQRHCAPKTPLSIFEALQLQECEVSHDSPGSFSFGLPVGWKLPADLVRTWDDFALLTDVCDWHLHEASAAALRCSGPLDCGHNRDWDLHLYTDGSAKAGQAGWAVVIVASNPHTGRCSFLGCFGGQLGAADDLGSSASDALQVALCWACLWTLPQIPFFQAAFNRTALRLDLEPVVTAV